MGVPILLTALLAAVPATYSASPLHPLCAVTPPMSTATPDALGAEPTAEPPLAATDGANCSEPPATPPAVIDCNDARMSVWVDLMIGSCDMPRVAYSSSLRTPKPASVACDLFGCGRSTPNPIHGVSRATGDSVPLGARPPEVSPPLTHVLFAATDARVPSSIPHAPPEPPPRA